MDTSGRLGTDSDAESVPCVLWGLPTAVSVIQEGDPNDFSMRFARVHQETAEKQFLQDKNSILSGLLCIRTLELDIAHGMIRDCEARISQLEAKNAELTASLDSYSNKTFKQALLAHEIWAPVRDCEARVAKLEATNAELKATMDSWSLVGKDTSIGKKWDPIPEMMRSVVTESAVSSPITLSQVVRELGYVCSGSELRRLAAIVHEAFVSEHGHPPRPKVYYDDMGQAERLSCFTEDDRRFLVRVLTSSKILQGRPKRGMPG